MLATLLEVLNLKSSCYRQVSFTVSSAEVVTVSGASGSGKSLLLRAIADLDPHEGDIRLSGFSQREMPANQWRRKVGFLPAEYFFWGDTAGCSFPQNRDAGEVLNKLRLPGDIIHKTVNRLSSGERQRLAIARLLLNEPACLLLDEPTSHLDNDTTMAAESLILAYRKQHGCPVIWVSHNKDQQQRISQRHYQAGSGELIEVPL